MSNEQKELLNLRLPSEERIKFQNPTTQQGVKFDDGKAKLSLVNRETLVGIAKAMEYGMGKYGKNNYKLGMDWSRTVDALLRHATAWAAKEDNDTESGLNHLYHAAACLNMLIYYIENNVGTDDR